MIDGYSAEENCINSGNYKYYIDNFACSESVSAIQQWVKVNNSIVCQCQLSSDESRFAKLENFENLLRQCQGVEQTSEVQRVLSVVCHNACTLRVLQTRNTQVDRNEIRDWWASLLKNILTIVCSQHDVTIQEDFSNLSLLSVCDQLLNLACGSDILLLVYDTILLFNSLQWKKAVKLLEKVKNVIATHKDTKLHQPLMCVPFNAVTAHLPVTLPHLINNLLCVIYFEMEDHTLCERMLCTIEEGGHKLCEEFGYMKAVVHYNCREFTSCVNVLQPLLTRSCQSNLLARCYNLIGCCFAQQSAPQSAVQQFQMALNSDLAFLVPLHNVSIQYRWTGVHDAELEALNLLSLAVKECREKEQSVTSSPGHLVSKHNLTESAILYTLARRCMEQGRFDVAATQYSELITLLKCQTQLCLNVPTMQQLLYETCCSLLATGSFQRCLEICDDLTTVLSTQSRQQRSYDNIEEEDDDLMSVLSEENIQSQEHMTSEDALLECRVLLCKAECLHNLSRADEALCTLNSLTNKLGKLMKNSCILREHCLTLLQSAYINKSVVYASMGDGLQAMHASRLAVQCKDQSLPQVPTRIVFTHVLVRLKFHNSVEVAYDWLSHRGVDVKQSQPRRLQLLLEDYTARLKQGPEGAKGEKVEKFDEDHQQYQQLDVCCLKLILNK